MAAMFSIEGNHTEDIKWYCFYCVIADSEENLNSSSDSPSMTSTPQSEGKTPLSPRDFWREKDGSFMFVLFSLSKSHAVGHSAMGTTWIEKWLLSVWKEKQWRFRWYTIFLVTEEMTMSWNTYLLIFLPFFFLLIKVLC